MYKDDSNNQYLIFEKIRAIFIFFAMLFTTSLFAATNKFVQLWIGDDKLIGIYAFICMIMSLFLSTINRPFLIIRDAKALYKETRRIAILETTLNIILSIILVKYFDLFGLVFATLIATLVTNCIFYPIKIYKNVFKKNYVRHFIDVIVSIAITLILCLLINNVNIINNVDNYIMWFIYSIVYAIIIFVIVFLMNYLYSKSFRNFSKEMFASIKNKFIK